MQIQSEESVKWVPSENSQAVIESFGREEMTGYRGEEKDKRKQQGGRDEENESCRVEY